MNETFTGKVWVLDDDIDTDIIIPTEYLALKTVQDMTPYAFSPLRPELAAQIHPGDIIVAGKNFGCGSSREQAPEIIKALGIKCVIARSFARIFFRNAINIGLPIIECENICQFCTVGDELEANLSDGTIRNITRGTETKGTVLPDFLLDIMTAGGLLNKLAAEQKEETV